MRRQRLEKKLKQRVMRMGQTSSHFRRLRNPRLAPVVERNINTILELRQEMERSRCLQERVADAITAWSGSMLFVYVHVIWFGLWIVINLHLTRFPAFDPYPFGLLTMIVSLEAIFLSTFVMISQNRADGKRQALADQQWMTVQEEDRQNKELLELSKQILAMTKEVHAGVRPGGSESRA